MAHLPLKKLLAFHYDQLPDAEKDDVQAHLDACASCEKNLTLLVKPESALKIKPASTGTRVTEQSACLSPETIGKYMNRELLPAEIPDVEKHLTACEDCRRQLVAISQISTEPVGEEARKILDALPPLEIAGHVSAIQEMIKKLEKPEPMPVNFRPKEKWSLDLFVPRPAFAFITILLLGIAGKWWVWPTYRYARFVAQGKAQLVAQHGIYYRSELRPAGDYRSSDKLQEMGPEKKPPKVDALTEEKREAIDALLKQALTYRPNGEAARRSLAQYYLLEKQYAVADSVLKLLEAASPQNAGVRNDRGYWFYHRRQYEAAAAAFAEAFALNPRLDQALYNLAITQTQLGDSAAAGASWEKYLTLDGVKPGWRNAARAQLQELK